MKALPLLLAFVLLSRGTPLWGQWEVTPIGSADACAEGLYLGRGIETSEIRLYSTAGWCRHGRGYEWSYEDGAWSGGEVYRDLDICYSPVAAALKAPGERRLYVGGYSHNRVYEVNLDNGAWTPTVVPGTDIDTVVCVRTGEARNDGIPRLYVSHGDAGPLGGLYEFEWDEAAGDWEKLRVHDRDVGEFAIGDGRNDGVLRIYLGAREGGDGGPVEYTWDPGDGRYVGNVLQFEGILEDRIQSAHVGDGRGDGIQRVYVNEWGGRLVELTHQAGVWTPVQVAGNARRFYLKSGRLRPDNQQRLYACVQGRGLYEYTWTGSEYEASVDAITAATGKIVIGDGRNDGKNRIYVGYGDRSGFSGTLAEVSDPNPPDAELPGGGYRRGDANGDGAWDISDGIYVLFFLFVGTPEPPLCEKSGDADDNGSLEITDAIYLLDFLFLAGPPPERPFPGCGPDPTSDGLTCESFPACE